MASEQLSVAKELVSAMRFKGDAEWRQHVEETLMILIDEIERNGNRSHVLSMVDALGRSNDD